MRPATPGRDVLEVVVVVVVGVSFVGIDSGTPFGERGSAVMLPIEEYSLWDAKIYDHLMDRNGYEEGW